MLIFAEANGLSLPPPERFPLVGLVSPLNQPLGLVKEALAGNSIEDDAELARPLGIDRLTRANQLGSQGRADQARQPLRSAPTGNQADLHLRQTNFRLRMSAGQAIVESQGQLQTSTHARALNGS